MTDLTFLCAHKNSVFVELQASGISMLVQTEDVKMKPLFWLEDSPVYKGDFVYHKNLRATGHVVGLTKPNDVRVKFSNEEHARACLSSNLSITPFAKPKTERKGWINIWKCSSSMSVSTGSQVYTNKEAALRGLLGDTVDLVDTIEITWME